MASFNGSVENIENNINKVSQVSENSTEQEYPNALALYERTKDYIVEQGTSGIWTYRKWNSGIAECWGSVEFKGETTFTAWGNIYRSAEVFGKQAYPFTFTDRPQLFVSLDKTANSTIVWLLLFAYSESKSETPSYALACPNNTTGDTNYLYLHYCAKGRWK